VRAVVQRVAGAEVRVAGELKGSIGPGLLVYLGVAPEDSEGDAEWLAEKIAGLRIFEDGEGKMNLSVRENAESSGIVPAVLAVSQFTLMGDARKGRRPSWTGAAAPEPAAALYRHFIERIRQRGLTCETGEFRASMMVGSVNAGPVTILLDTKDL